MAKTAILAVRIIGDATDAVLKIDKTAAAAKTMQDKMDQASKGAAVALGGIAAAAIATGNAASEAEQAIGAVESVFKDYADGVMEYADKAADAVGLSEQQYASMASVLGSQLKNMGVSLEDAGGQTNDLIERGADLSAMFGGTTAEAVGALSSLLRGERDPIERYGVSINQAAIDAQKAAMGLDGLSGEAEKNANLQATLALLTQQTADAQGQFGRESETAAGQQQRATAEWANASAELGQSLLPVMTEGSKILGELGKFTAENTGLVTGLAAGIAVLAAGIIVINGAMKIYAAIQAIQTAAQWASNAAWLASPITWIVLAVVAAIALLVVAAVLIVEHWDEIKLGAEIVWAAVIDWVRQVGDWFDSVFTAIGDWWNGLVDSWRMGIDQLVGWIRDALDWFGQLASSVVPDWAKDMLGMSGATFTATTIAGGGATASPMLAGTFSAAALTGASATVPASVSSAGRARVTAGDTYVTENHYTINGAIDTDGTARTIRNTQRDHQGRVGRGESRWAR